MTCVHLDALSPWQDSSKSGFVVFVLLRRGWNTDGNCCKGFQESRCEKIDMPLSTFIHKFIIFQTYVDQARQARLRHKWHRFWLNNHCYHCRTVGFQQHSDADVVVNTSVGEEAGEEDCWVSDHQFSGPILGIT